MKSDSKAPRFSTKNLFWAFAAFIGVTRMADARASAIARQLYVWRIRALLSNYRREVISMTSAFALSIGFFAHALLDLTPRGGYTNFFYACGISVLAVGMLAYLIRYSRWLYQDDINNLKLRKGT